MLSGAVQYEGVLAESGEVFDSTREDNTIFSFELGKGSVIQAWEIAVKTMKVRKKNKLSIRKICSMLCCFFFLLNTVLLDCSNRSVRLLKSLASLNMLMEVLVLHQTSHQSNVFTLSSFSCDKRDTGFGNGFMIMSQIHFSTKRLLSIIVFCFGLDRTFQPLFPLLILLMKYVGHCKCNGFSYSNASCICAPQF